MALKVVVWGTGSMGFIALRSVIDHPDLELAGLVVHSKEHVGVDAGVLCGGPPVGVEAIDDPEVAVTGDVDVVAYMVSGDLRMAEAVDDMARLLAAGQDVISCSVLPLVFPPAYNASQVAQLEAACRSGRASCYTSGIDPGFANGVLPLVLSGACRRIETVRVMEIFNYGTYPQPAATFDLHGLGRPPDYPALAFLPGSLKLVWGAVVEQLAAGLGVEMDEVREMVEKRVVDQAVETPVGTVEAGTVGAFRFEVQGMAAGEQVITVEHVTRMHNDIASDWPQPHITMEPRDHGFPGADGQGHYRIEIEGSPSIHCDLELADGRDHDLGARVGGVVHIVNSIPAVHAAPAGLLTATDLPLVTGRGVVGPVTGPLPDNRLIPEFLGLVDNGRAEGR